MLIWYGAGLIAAILVAWIASMVHASGHAPVGLVSLGVGFALGATIFGIAVSQRLAWGRCLIFTTIVLAVLAIVAQHAWLYLDFRRQWHESRTKSAAAAMFRSESPLTPAEYFRHEGTPRQVSFWCVDAALIIASAVGTGYALRRQPR